MITFHLIFFFSKKANIYIKIKSYILLLQELKKMEFKSNEKITV